MQEQICFLTEDEYLICNGIYRNGLFIPAKKKWYKFKPNKKRKTT